VLGYEIYGRGKALMDAGSVWTAVSISGLVAAGDCRPAHGSFGKTSLAHAIALKRGGGADAGPQCARAAFRGKAIANALDRAERHAGGGSPRKA